MNTTWRELMPLPILALLGALLLTSTYLATATRIHVNQQHAADTILIDALALPTDTTLTNTGNTDDRELLALHAPRTIYLAQQNGQVIALILPLVARDGYNGAIDLIAGIAPDGSIVGVRALNHRETAGLGNRIDTDKSDWIKQFIGKSLRAPEGQQWSLHNEGGAFDQITGATVTSRAVVHAVYQALQYFELHRAQLLFEANTYEANTHEANAREADHE